MINGRVTLAKSVLSSLPLYVMQSLILPKGVRNDMEKTIRQFIWGSTSTSKKIHLLPWEKVTKPVTEGGLGVRDIHATNTATLAKLGWRLMTEPESLWARILRVKYCDNRRDIDMFSKKANASFIWRGIEHGAPILHKGIRMAIGNGQRTLFWSHRWLCETPLEDLVIAPIPDETLGATVAELWNGLDWKWHLLQCCLPAHILKLLKGHRLTISNANTEDGIFWSENQSGIFTTKSALNIISPTEVNTDFNWSYIWKAPTRQRVRNFLHLAANSILCNATRLRRHLSQSSACTRCQQEESSIHALRDCQFVKEIWMKLGNMNADGDFFKLDMKSWLTQNLKRFLEHQILFHDMACLETEKSADF